MVGRLPAREDTHTSTFAEKSVTFAPTVLRTFGTALRTVSSTESSTLAAHCSSFSSPSSMPGWMVPE